MPLNPRAALRAAQGVVAQHQQAAQQDTPQDLVARLEVHLFGWQRGLYVDEHRYITACAGRRAGKSVGVAVLLLATALLNPKRVCLYLSLSRVQARDILWAPIKELNERYGLGGEPNETDLHLTFPNGSVIAFGGVNDRPSIERYRGQGIALCVIDEAQSVPAYIEQLVDDVIAPALADSRGKLVVIGTPSLLPSGWWFDAAHDTASGVWGHHTATMFDNPFIVDPQKTLEEELARRHVTIDDASIQRETFGRWVKDEKSAVFVFADKNWFDVLPMPLGWKYVIGGDLGLRDADSLSVLAYHQQLPNQTFLVEEFSRSGQDVTAFAETLKGLVERYGRSNISRIVIDPGGMGAKIIEEVRTRHRIPAEPARKQEKIANIQLLAAALRAGHFRCHQKGLFATSAATMEWDWEKSTPDKLVYRGHAPDIVDSVLYAFVESLAWNSKAPEKKTAETPEEWARRDIERAVAEQQAKQRVERRAQVGLGRALGLSAWESIARGGE